jgi:cysteinyl-tRNA synthetase
VTELNKSRSVTHARQLKALAGIIGILQRPPREFLQGMPITGSIGWTEESDTMVATGSVIDIDALIAQRIVAKKQRNFAESDKIRAELLAAGIILEDKPDGTTNWRRA